jgi:hypothetical protein
MYVYEYTNSVIWNILPVTSGKWCRLSLVGDVYSYRPPLFMDAPDRLRRFFALYPEIQAPYLWVRENQGGLAGPVALINWQEDEDSDWRPVFVVTVDQDRDFIYSNLRLQQGYLNINVMQEGFLVNGLGGVPNDSQHLITDAAWPAAPVAGAD